MKKRGVSLLLAGTIAMALLVPGAAQAANDKIHVSLEGQVLELGQDPFVQQDRTFVPLRAIFEKLGAQVSWDDVTQTVTATNGDVTVKLTVDSKTAYRNDVAIELDAAPMTREDRVYVPVRFIAESFNNPVKWEEATKTVQVQKSNRARIEQLVASKPKDVKSAHAHTLSTMVFNNGKAKMEMKQDVAGDFVIGADGKYDIHVKVERSATGTQEMNSYELYAKGDRVYVAFNGFNKWQTSLRDKVPHVLPPIPAQEEQLFPEKLQKIAKYATLNDEGAYDVLTFRLTEKQMAELDGEKTTSVLTGVPMTITIELEKDTYRVHRMTIDSSTHKDNDDMVVKYLFEYDNYNKLTEITLPAEVLQAEESDLGDLR